ncbi:hypothetical protein [Bifidobacterium miconisargentati]|uniref:hypothetical protein n=1 Tax=Bifidobacterium miconisargentati TaxID=2834437 RepID=UPI001F25BB70|nr:hypothetical protein [Bifidobacterium miconisargentati]
MLTVVAATLAAALIVTAAGIGGTRLWANHKHRTALASCETAQQSQQTTYQNLKKLASQADKLSALNSAMYDDQQLHEKLLDLTKQAKKALGYNQSCSASDATETLDQTTAALSGEAAGNKKLGASLSDQIKKVERSQESTIDVKLEQVILSAKAMTGYGSDTVKDPTTIDNLKAALSDAESARQSDDPEKKTEAYANLIDAINQVSDSQQALLDDYPSGTYSATSEYKGMKGTQTITFDGQSADSDMTITARGKSVNVSISYDVKLDGDTVYLTPVSGYNSLTESSDVSEFAANRTMTYDPDAGTLTEAGQDGSPDVTFHKQ